MLTSLHRAGLSCAILVVLVSSVFTTRAGAQFIDGSSLFLSPTQVPDGFYTPIVLPDNGAHTFTASDFGAQNLDAIHILPVLNPNPSSGDGSYSFGDLAAINSSNYSSYYGFQPNVDYNATTITGKSSTAMFDQPGQYFVQVATDNGAAQQFTLEEVNVGNDAFAEDPAAGAADKAGANRKIAAPDADLIVISDGDPNDNGAMANAMTQFPTAQKANSLAALKQKIIDYYNAHGMKKFEVAVFGHGRPGSIKIGTERINNDTDSNMTPAQFQAMIDPYVKSIHFYSCSTGAGTAGTAFLQAFGSSIGLATGFDAPVTVATTYLDTSAMGKQLTAVPEPATACFVMLVLGATVSRRRGRMAVR